MEYEDDKPSIGLQPKSISAHYDFRRNDIKCALMERLKDNGRFEIPIEWIEEYNEIVRIRHS